jgi:hypothetical protein
MAILRVGIRKIQQGRSQIFCRALPHLLSAPCPHGCQKPFSPTFYGRRANSTISLALSVPNGPSLLLGNANLATSRAVCRPHTRDRLIDRSRTND